MKVLCKATFDFPEEGCELEIADDVAEGMTDEEIEAEAKDFVLGHLDWIWEVVE